jgi:NADPH:quinone reductase
MNGLTAQLTLDLLDLAEGHTLAVTGAAGCFGGYVVELAKVGGLRVIGDAAESDEGLVAELGADVVVRRGDDVAGRFFDACPGGVDALADGALLHTLALGAVRAGGRLAAVRPFVGETERQITVHQVWVRTYAREHDKLDRLRQLAEDGRLTPRVAARFPPEEAAEAHRLLEAGGIRGRLVIEF